MIKKGYEGVLLHPPHFQQKTNGCHGVGHLLNIVIGIFLILKTTDQDLDIIFVHFFIVANVNGHWFVLWVVHLSLSVNGLC